MLHHLSRPSGFSIKAAPRALPTPGSRLLVTGKRGPAFTPPPPKCRDCRDFQTVVTRAGRVECHCLTGASNTVQARTGVAACR